MPGYRQGCSHLFDIVAILKMEGLALRDQVFDRLHTVFRRLDQHAALVLVVAAKADRTIDFGDDRRDPSDGALQRVRQRAADHR